MVQTYTRTYRPHRGTGLLLALLTSTFLFAEHSTAAPVKKSGQPVASPERVDALRIANLIKDRTSMVCDGSLRQLLANYVIEYKDAKEYTSKVQFTPPSSLDKLNYPEYRGTYTISFSIIPAPSYVREIESFFPSSFDTWKVYSDRVLDSWLSQNVTSLWTTRRNLTVSPVPLIVSVQNYGGTSFVSNVVFANDGNWGRRQRVNYAFMPIGPYVDTVNLASGKENKERISGFWNFVGKLNQTSLVPQNCEIFSNPAKVAATAFLLRDDATSSHQVYQNYVDYHQVGPFFTSAKWRNAVYRSVGADFAFSNREHRPKEASDAAGE